MKIVISGYGKMGRQVEQSLLARGIICAGVTESVRDFDKQKAAESVCIDFTTPAAFIENYRFIADNFKAAVIGTTGWQEIKEEVVEYFKEKNTTMIYASNFSIGVNIFFEISEIASKLLKEFPEYQPFLLEMHHNQKLDAPSGTAKTLASIVEANCCKPVETQSVRCGSIPGIHELGFESAADRIWLRHEAFSRQGFADGAVTAALWTEEVNGTFEFRELLKERFNKTIWNE